MKKIIFNSISELKEVVKGKKQIYIQPNDSIMRFKVTKKKLFTELVGYEYHVIGYVQVYEFSYFIIFEIKP
jgi:hypothetical protein